MPVPDNIELVPLDAIDVVFTEPAPPAPTVTMYVAPEYKVVDEV
jgi:hypothetical protein